MKTTFAYLGVMLLAFGCTTAQQPPKPRSEFKNLQVLPPDIPHDHLIATMRSFTRGLGVKCNECHVVTATSPEEQLDFASDAKEHQRVEKAEGEHHKATAPADAAEERKVSCWTCHRGKTEPEAAAPQAAR